MLCYGGKIILEVNFYLEIMNHNQEDEKVVNEVIKKFSKNHEVKLIATNNNYYSEKQDANAHDILLCVKDGEKQSTPIGRGRGFRYGLPNHEYYYKSSDEMKSLFADCSESITNIQEIIDKTEAYTLARDVLLPKFEIPSEFEDPNDLEDLGKKGENNYLRHLTYQGAKKRYSELTDKLIERLDFELNTIEKTGYPGLFSNCRRLYTRSKKYGCVRRSWKRISCWFSCSILFMDNKYRSN